MTWKFIRTSMAAVFALMCMCLWVIFPEEAWKAALQGVSIWWEVLFPALFPFFVLSELLLGFGVVHFIGCILDPMMRPVFRLPGIGGFVMAMGFASGYPVGTRMTLRLWQQKQLTKSEAERLIAFTTTADPIFLVSAVCLGFFQDIRLASIVLIAHYSGAVLVGILMRNYAYGDHSPVQPQNSNRPAFLRAFEAMHKARMNDGRSPAFMITQAIQHALQLIFVVGGLVVFFCVCLALWRAGHLLTLFESIIKFLLPLCGIDRDFSSSILYGIFEVTLGTKTAARGTSYSSLMWNIAIASFILAWSGLSVHAQILSICSPLKMNYVVFLCSRLLHGCLSASLALLCWHPIQSYVVGAVSVYDAAPRSPDVPVMALFQLPNVSLFAWVFASCLGIILILYVIYVFLQKVNDVWRISKF